MSQVAGYFNVSAVFGNLSAGSRGRHRCGLRGGAGSGARPRTCRPRCLNPGRTPTPSSDTHSPRRSGSRRLWHPQSAGGPGPYHRGEEQFRVLVTAGSVRAPVHSIPPSSWLPPGSRPEAVADTHTRFGGGGALRPFAVAYLALQRLQIHTTCTDSQGFSGISHITAVCSASHSIPGSADSVTFARIECGM